MNMDEGLNGVEGVIKVYKKKIGGFKRKYKVEDKKYMSNRVKVKMIKKSLFWLLQFISLVIYRVF